MMPTTAEEYNKWKDNNKVVTTPTEKTPLFSENKHKVDDMRTELEVQRLEFEKKKLEIDMQKLAKPDTSIDYYSKMLEMQNTFNNQLLAMQKQNFETQLQLAKLELGTESETEKWLGFLEPYLPTLLSRFTGSATSTAEQPIYVHNERGELVPNPNLYKLIDTSKSEGIGEKSYPSISVVDEVSHSPDTNSPRGGVRDTTIGATQQVESPEQTYEMNLKQYQQDVRDGKISLEQAWADWNNIKDRLPKFLQRMTFEEFKETYDKTRKGGT